MQNLSPEIFKQIQEAICRPEGTFTFKYTCKKLFDPNAGKGILIEIPSKGHLFRLERDENLLVHFYHSSPGTGTRVATINLNKVTPSRTVFLAFSWTPNEIYLHFGPQDPGEKLISAKGTISKKQFRVSDDGSVFEIGGPGIEIIGTNIFANGKPILQPTAIDAWNETIKATKILGTGKSDKGYIFEVAVTNLSLAILVTGFEAYTKKRFLEIEKEGIQPEIDAIIKSFFPKKEREDGIGEILETKAKEEGKTILQLIVEKNVINFQNFKKCKLAFNKAYGLKFGEIGLEQSTPAKIKKFILYRHRIIHISALQGMLNQAEVPPEEPVFPKKELALEATMEFESLIKKIHEATLKLRRKN